MTEQSGPDPLHISSSETKVLSHIIYFIILFGFYTTLHQRLSEVIDWGKGQSYLKSSV